ncbi:MAG: hypothetical protein IJ311_06335, partial [Elusimicrobiaceae bacterium]|nr:hypothetical protein [Elusimicrobiaceae bacterium]
SAKNKTIHIKKIKQRGMKTIYFDHIHTVRTDGRRERTDAQRLAALRWPRFTFGEFYLIDSPPFLSL